MFVKFSVVWCDFIGVFWIVMYDLMLKEIILIYGIIDEIEVGF